MDPISFHYPPTPRRMQKLESDPPMALFKVPPDFNPRDLRVGILVCCERCTGGISKPMEKEKARAGR